MASALTFRTVTRWPRSVSGAVQRFGKLHGLVNSAGIRGVGNVLDLDPEAWRRVLSVNLDGTFNV